MGAKRRILIILSILTLLSLTCSLLPADYAQKSAGDNRLSAIIFCKDVSDSGKCIGPADSFPAGTTIVWAYFTFQNMKNGQKWSRVWTQDGNVYTEDRDLAWSDGDKGWMAYSVEDPAGLAGLFTLTVYLGKDAAQAGSFDVAEATIVTGEPGGSGKSSGFPAFGPITMAHDVSDEGLPIDATDSFEPGVKEVVAVFPYANMGSGQAYSAVWLHEGKEVAHNDFKWNDTPSGMHSTSLYDDNPLPAGQYTLNLLLDDQIARSVKFEIQGEATETPNPTPVVQKTPTHPDRPATPDEVVDPGALKYWNMIAQSPLPVLQGILETNLKGWTRVKVTASNDCGKDAAACWNDIHCDNRDGGIVEMPQETMASEPDYVVAATLAHELTHGQEYYQGMKCGCTIEKEFYAFGAELDFLYYGGYKDYFFQHYSGLFDETTGKFRTDVMWNKIKTTYQNAMTCPDY